MAAAAFYHVEVVLADQGAMPKDACINTFSFAGDIWANDAAAVNDIRTAVEDFYTSSNTNRTLGDYIAASVKRGGSATTVKVYNVTGHLDGSDAGSPVGTHAFDIPAAHDSAGLIPAEVAVCGSFHADLSGLSEFGATVSTIPTGDEAVDEGAPSTHTGRERPKSRLRGRIYLGPLHAEAVESATGSKCRVRSILRQDLVDAMSGLVSGTSSWGGGWCVWSRRNAAMETVTGGWVDNAFDTIRGRGPDPSVRLTF